MKYSQEKQKRKKRENRKIRIRKENILVKRNITNTNAIVIATAANVVRNREPTGVTN